MTIKLNSGKTVSVATASTLSAAASIAKNYGQWVVMAETGTYYVCKPRDAARLEAAGYEILPQW